jgi:hypothetical protein
MRLKNPAKRTDINHTLRARAHAQHTLDRRSRAACRLCLVRRRLVVVVFVVVLVGRRGRHRGRFAVYFLGGVGFLGVSRRSSSVILFFSLIRAITETREDKKHTNQTFDDRFLR